MAYVKTNWQNGVTPVNADNMNKIENELEALDQAGGGSGGGTQLYFHDIGIHDDNYIAYFNLITTSQTPFSVTTLKTFCSGGKVLPGYFGDTTAKNFYSLIRAQYESDLNRFNTTYIKAEKLTSHAWTSSCTVTDTVTPL